MVFLLCKIVFIEWYLGLELVIAFFPHQYLDFVKQPWPFPDHFFDAVLHCLTVIRFQSPLSGTQMYCILFPCDRSDLEQLLREDHEIPQILELIIQAKLRIMFQNIVGIIIIAGGISIHDKSAVPEVKYFPIRIPAELGGIIHIQQCFHQRISRLCSDNGRSHRTIKNKIEKCRIG